MRRSEWDVKQFIEGIYRGYGVGLTNAKTSEDGIFWEDEILRSVWNSELREQSWVDLLELGERVEYELYWENDRKRNPLAPF